jgi:hypothetical protein
MPNLVPFRLLRASRASEASRPAVDIRESRDDDHFMVRAFVLATIVLLPRAVTGQEPGRLQISVALADAAGTPTPVPRHTLLISGIPPSDVPRRLATGPDGMVRVNLAPGSYTVESDRPLSFQGKTLQWMRVVDIVAGRDTVLELTAANAMARPGSLPSEAAAEATPSPDAAALLTQWQHSVVALWTPTRQASGFVIDPRGLVVTNQRVVGTATSVEVQVTPVVKMAGQVLAADPDRDVVILRVDPAAVASLPQVPLPCTLAAEPRLAPGDEIVTIGSPLAGHDEIAFGTVRSAARQALVADFGPGHRTGGPVFAENGATIGLTSVLDGADERQRDDVRIVGVGDVCAVVRLAEGSIKDMPPPDETPLPVEPATPFPVSALKDAVARRAGSLRPYAMSTSDFDMAFITPVVAYAGTQGLTRPPMDFSNWSEYVGSAPPVLLVRVTPKLVESFWMTVARGAAWTQGAALPPIKRFESGFSRLRAFCGEREVPPIHPFKLELRISETDAVYEGLSVFGPDALGPHCGRVRLVLYSDKAPDQGDSREVDPKVLRQIWQDFEPYRAGQ